MAKTKDSLKSNLSQLDKLQVIDKKKKTEKDTSLLSSEEVEIKLSGLKSSFKDRIFSRGSSVDTRIIPNKFKYSVLEEDLSELIPKYRQKNNYTSPFIPSKPTKELTVSNEDLNQLLSDVESSKKIIFSAKNSHKSTAPKGKTTVTDRILNLIKEYKLTADNVADYLSTVKHVQNTKIELKGIIFILQNEDKLDTISCDGETILKPKNLTVAEEKSWDLLSRKMSRDWISNRLYIGSNFQKSSKVYNRLMRVSSYNQVYRPTLKQSVYLEDGSECSLFSSNDYLGLSKHPLVCNKAIEVINSYGHGSGGSRILSGTTPEHRNLEKKIASFKYADDAIVFSSGFMANLGLFSLIGKDWIVLYDSLAHTSLLEGLKLSQAKGIRFKHNDVDDLSTKLLEHYDHKKKLIVVEGVYSMDGDIGRLDDIYLLAQKFNAFLAVDEAHSVGTIGKTGKGVLEYFNLPPDAIDFKIGTLGKSVGAEGGYIAGKKPIIDVLRYSANSFLFSTSLPASTMAGASEAFRIMEQDVSFTKKLQQRSSVFRTKLKLAGFDIGLSQTHIIPIIIPDLLKLETIQQCLKEDGILVNIVTFPAIPVGQSRLRINLTAGHTDAQVNHLFESLMTHAKKLGIIPLKKVVSFI